MHLKGQSNCELNFILLMSAVIQKKKSQRKGDQWNIILIINLLKQKGQFHKSSHCKQTQDRYNTSLYAKVPECVTFIALNGSYHEESEGDLFGLLKSIQINRQLYYLTSRYALS